MRKKIVAVEGIVAIVVTKVEKGREKRKKT